MAAPLTGANLPSQSGKVFIVTGASGGLGAALTSILYAHHARIYVAARSHSKASATIAAIAAQHPSSKGSLVYLHLDLDDLRTIKASAQQFLDAEERLDVLWNNAGCMLPAPERARTSQGWERQLGVNAMGPALFTMCLRDVLARTAGREGVERNQVRVVWVSSNMSTWAPRPAVDLGNMRYERAESADTKYMRSKAGTNFLAVEFQRRVVGEGVVSVVVNPGVHMTDLQRDQSGPRRLLVRLISSPPENGAFTELYAGLSPDVTVKTSLDGQWVVPNGKLKALRSDYMDEAQAKQYWEWIEEQVKQYR